MKFLVVLLLGHMAFAATEKAAETEFAGTANAKVADYYDSKVSSQIIAKWADGKRKPAGATQYSEADVKPDTQKIDEQILAIKVIESKDQSQVAANDKKAADDIQAVLNQLEASYEHYSDDAKFFAAQMLLLKPLRGIVWRMRPLFEQKNGTFDFFSGNRATHSAAVTILRALYQTTKIYVPTSQADAIFKYVTVPSSEMKLSDQFKTVESFQNFLRGKMYAALDLAAKRTATIYKNGTTPYVYDAKVLYGIGAFDDGVARYVACSDAEVAMAQASLQGAMHSIDVFFAYDQNQLMNVAGDLGRLYGVDGFSQQTLGVTAKQRQAVLIQYKNAGFLHIKDASNKHADGYGQKYMSDALVHLDAQVRFLQDARDILDKSPNNNGTILNPLFFKPDAQPRLEAGLIKMRDMVQRSTPVHSGITGENVVVDIPGFYSNAPKQMLDLLPTAFNTVASHEYTITNSVGENLIYRDYSEDRAIGWSNSAWSKLFPKLGQRQTVADAFRTIEYTAGPSMLFGPMSSFLF